MIFAYGEDDAHRLQLRDDDHAVAVAGMHDVARVDETQANDAADGRGDVAVIDVELRGIKLALIVLDGAFVLLDERVLCGELLFGNRVLSKQGGVARNINARVIEQRLIACELAFNLRDDGLIRARIDFDERVAGAHQVALFEVYGHELAVDAALHCDGGDGGCRTEARDIDADVACLRLRDDDWRVTAASGFACGLAGLLCCGLIRVSAIPEEGDRGKERKEHPGPYFVLRLFGLRRRRRRGQQQLRMFGRGYFRQSKRPRHDVRRVKEIALHIQFVDTEVTRRTRIGLCEDVLQMSCRTPINKSSGRKQEVIYV